MLLWGFSYRPPLLVAAVAEPVYSNHPGLLQGTFKEYAHYHRYLNISMPVLSMVFAAQTLGIASCILSPHIGKANKILPVPHDHEIPLLVGLGYEKPGAYQKTRERHELKEL